MVQRITIQAHQHRDGHLELLPDQRHYLNRVLRLQPGASFIAQDGQGMQWLATLNAPPTSATVVKVVADQRVAQPPLRLIAAIPKGNAFDQVVRQATELGVSHICPVMSDRTLVKPSSHKLSRWQRIAAEASEQCERGTIPSIAEPTDLRTCLNILEAVSINHESNADRTAEAGYLAKHVLRYICAARVENTPHLLEKIQKDFLSEGILEVNLMVGPEGGWTSGEITVATQYGYEAVSLGSAILRAVTASITALSLVASSRELLI